MKDWDEFINHEKKQELS